MSPRTQALVALAGDVLVAASRRRTLWYYLIASTALVGALVLGLDLTLEVTRAEPAGPLPRTVSLGLPVVPGSARAEAGDAAAPLPVADDAAALARGVVTVLPGPDVAEVSSLRLAYAVSLVGLRGEPRERALDQARATTLWLYGLTVKSDPVLPPRISAAYLLSAILFAFILGKGVASFFGLVLGLLATSDAVSSALEPGAAELLLSRPLARHDVVLGRFAGAVAFGLVQLAWLVGLAVALCGLKFGVWVPEALAVVGPLLLKFTLLLAVATAVAVATRTPALGLAGAALVWAVSAGTASLPASVALPERLAEGLGWVQRVAPPVTHLDAAADLSLAVPVLDPGALPWAHSTALALGWVVALLGATIVIVRRRDH
ncbi:MAG: ABC transporter permease [Planctomycetes bacterium]|nr:ABC transporter permease [Planctomycetota bacterium]